MRTSSLLLAALLLPALTGCRSNPAAPSASAQQQTAALRAELERIPAPLTARYATIKSLDSWQNPYLTIQGDMVTIHVLLADANTSDIGVGSILRPLGARRQDLNVRAADLPEAINAIPDSAWPYGRVVALEEAHNAPASALPNLAQTKQIAEQSLASVGVTVYDWHEGGPSLK